MPSLCQSPQQGLSQKISQLGVGTIITSLPSPTILAKKMSPPHQNNFSENTMGNSFLGTPFFGTKRYKKKQNSKYVALYQKTAFGFDPRPREVPKAENTKICGMKLGVFLRKQGILAGYFDGQLRFIVQYSVQCSLRYSVPYSVQYMV